MLESDATLQPPCTSACCSSPIGLWRRRSWNQALRAAEEVASAQKERQNATARHEGTNLRRTRLHGPPDSSRKLPLRARCTRSRPPSPGDGCKHVAGIALPGQDEERG